MSAQGIMSFPSDLKGKAEEVKKDNKKTGPSKLTAAQGHISGLLSTFF